jgi:tetratricopeptide (TPR) repeat protein
MREYLLSKDDGLSNTKPFKFMQKWPSSFEQPRDHLELS